MKQHPQHIIDVAHWPYDEDWWVYPEGARDKRLYYAPQALAESLCFPDHKYLFKRSSHRYPEQYWVEIFACLLGQLLDVPVPAAYVAIDSRFEQSGALIEWFLLDEETYVPGGDIMQQNVKDYDRKKGKQHNFLTIANVCEQYHQTGHMPHHWERYWAAILVFDALIGNTDRHQDNWGIIYRIIQGRMGYVRLTPIFDNGTSMGHEIAPDKLLSFDQQKMHHYIKRGCHHLRWHDDDPKRQGHLEMVLRLCQQYPRSIPTVHRILTAYHPDKVEQILHYLLRFDVPQPLTVQRAEFMLKLINMRYQYILAVMDKLYAPTATSC